MSKHLVVISRQIVCCYQASGKVKRCVFEMHIISCMHYHDSFYPVNAFQNVFEIIRILKLQK